MPDATPPSGPPPHPGEPDRSTQQPGPSGRRRWVVAGAVVAAAAVVTGTAFGAAAIFGGNKSDLGVQPAQALPASSTFAYASIDFAPTDGEKGELITTLLKFPGFLKHASLSGGDDLRERLFEAITSSAGNSCNLSWDADFAPWAGEKAAVAGVEVDGKPKPVLVLQVTDGDKALAAFKKFDQCDPGEPASGYTVTGQWAVVGESQSTVDQVVAQDGKGTLADDANYQHWTGEAGDPGFVQAYAAPQAGQILADALAAHSGSVDPFAPETCTSIGSATSSGRSSSRTRCFSAPDPGTEFLRGVCPGIGGVGSKTAQSYGDALRRFQGAGFTGRVKNGGVEIEGAMDVLADQGAVPLTPTSDGAQLVAGLPDDTGAALGVSIPDHYYERLLDGFAQLCGKGFDPDAINQKLSAVTGLTFPADIDTLLGKAIALSVGQVDAGSWNALDHGGDPTQLPFALVLDGDSAAISGVLDKVLARIPAPIKHDTSGDRVVVGFSDAYRQHVVTGSGLGDTAAFKDVVPHAAQASSVIFVDFDRFDDAVKSSDAEAFTDYYQPLHAFGLSGWYDGTTSHMFARLSTD